MIIWIQKKINSGFLDTWTFGLLFHPSDFPPFTIFLDLSMSHVAIEGSNR